MPRQTGTSHVAFKAPRAGDPRINIQDDKSKAKARQVRQVVSETVAGMDALGETKSAPWANKHYSAEFRVRKRGSYARGAPRDRLDLDPHDLSLLRLLEHWVERVRLGPAVYWRVDSARNGSPPRRRCVRTWEIRPPSLTGLVQ